MLTCINVKTEGRMTAPIKKTKRKPTGAAAMGPGPGRPKGKPNKITATIKAALEECFHELGGAKWLVRVAKEDPKPIIVLLGKLIPNVVQAELTGKDGSALFGEEQIMAMAEIIRAKRGGKP